MSAFVVIMQRDSVHLATDCALYDQSATFLGTRPKHAVLPHLHASFAVTGHHALVPLVTNTLSILDDYSAIRRQAPDLLRQLKDHIGKISGDVKFSDFRLTMVGWLDGRPDAWVATTRPDDELPPFQAIPISGANLTPSSPDIQQAVIDLAAGRTSHDLDPARDGLAILEIQRRHKVKNLLGDGIPEYIVGGDAHLTSIYQDRIESRLLKRWSDKPGQKIAA